MQPRFIFPILRVGTNVLFFGLIAVTVIVGVKFGVQVYNQIAHKSQESVSSHDVLAFEEHATKPVSNFSDDKLVRYIAETNRYKVSPMPNSPLGYFAFYTALLNLGIGTAILGLFRKIFSEKNLGASFKQSVYRRLVMLAVLFGMADVLNFINYFIFNSLLKASISVPRFDLVTDLGSGLVTGLVIYAIAIVYQRGLSIQEENELTV